MKTAALVLSALETKMKKFSMHFLSHPVDLHVTNAAGWEHADGEDVVEMQPLDEEPVEHGRSGVLQQHVETLAKVGRVVDAPRGVLLLVPDVADHAGFPRHELIRVQNQPDHNLRDNIIYRKLWLIALRLRATTV